MGLFSLKSNSFPLDNEIFGFHTKCYLIFMCSVILYISSHKKYFLPKKLISSPEKEFTVKENFILLS